MAEKTRPYRIEAIAGVDLDVETHNEGTEIGIAAQGGITESYMGVLAFRGRSQAPH
jgi:hypothetical protein